MTRGQRRIYTILTDTTHAMQDIAMQDVATKADLDRAVHMLTVRGFAALATLGGLILAAIALF